MGKDSVIRIVLPFPPSVNHYWRHVVLGKPPKQRAATLLSKDGRKYKALVQQAVTQQGVAHNIADHVSMDILLFPPSLQRRDVDNYAKAILDALVEADVLDDDCLVRSLSLRWAEKKLGGQAVVSIAVMPNQQKQLSLMGAPKRGRETGK